MYDVVVVELLEEIKLSISTMLDDFYGSYLVETFDGVFRVIRTMTYGEMVIASLLVVLVMLFVMRWIWEVVN